jgi:hypothetical protein
VVNRAISEKRKGRMRKEWTNGGGTRLDLLNGPRGCDELCKRDVSPLSVRKEQGGGLQGEEKGSE